MGKTPQRSDSVKKPKIKLTTNSTPKGANGAANTPKSAKTTDSKSAKSKGKKKDADEEKSQETAVTKEPELSAEEKYARKTVCRPEHAIVERLGRPANNLSRKRSSSSGTSSRRVYSRLVKSPRKRR